MPNAVANREENNFQVALMTDLDFTKLNASVEKLGDSKNLSEKEKELGVKTLDDWKVNVLDKLETKRRELEDIQSFFNVGKSSYGYYGHNYDSTNYDKMKEALADLSRTKNLYQAYLDVDAEMEDLKLKEPQRPSVDPNKTIVENDNIFGKWQLESVKYEIEVKKLDHKKTTAYNTWISTMKKKQEIKHFLGGIETYLRKIQTYNQQAKDLAQLAKLNISISDEKVRDAIKELVNFTKNIK